jgi:hypothetical protein
VKEKEGKKRDAADAAEAERRKGGRLTGREIFLEEGFVAQDDLGASGTHAHAQARGEGAAAGGLGGAHAQHRRGGGGGGSGGCRGDTAPAAGCVQRLPAPRSAAGGAG